MTLVRPIQSRRQRRRRAPLRSEILIPRQGGLCSVGADDMFLGMSPGSVREHNSHLLEILKRIRLRVQDTDSLELDPDFCQSVMQDLRSIGLSAYTSLGDHFMEAFDTLEQGAGRPGLALTIRSDTFPLLWEMLYTGPFRGDVQEDKLWGFHHQIARFQIGNSAPEEELYPDSDFLFCCDRQLSHWRQEHDDIKRSVSHRFQFHSLDDALPHVAAYVGRSEPGECFVDTLALLELGLLHLACHCQPDPDQSSVLSSELTFSYESSQISVKLHELKAARRELGFALHPLVFLNACKTMTNPEHLVQGDSFPGGFLRLGASGVIATACDVPDKFAAAFASKFYEILCENVERHSPTVSEALLRTRQFFIRPPYYNPLGLVYGLYARNDLHIEWEPWIDIEEENQ
ncbi:CHAT domain-containing protein [candidate division KSB3 bacterium]|nr:CHAT domain-containing protein [candidate division KSB3 bacterium]